MIITRDVINKDIVFYDYSNEGDLIRSYGYNEVCEKIDFFKNYLMDLGCKKGESVLIGYDPGLNQLGLFFAVCELGLNFVVNDYKMFEKSSDYDFLDTKTKILLPINYFFDNPESSEYKRKYLANVSDNYIPYEKIEPYDNYKKNGLISAEPNDLLMKCTSSGTTGTPKKVLHTQEFLYNISKRNSIFFDKSVGLAYNLNHGSSLATYFIPCLMSERVKSFYNVPDIIFRNEDFKIEYSDKRYNILNLLDHIMIPYSETLTEVLGLFKVKDLTYYTLSSISPKMHDKKESYRDIVSIFGCNETSGPLMINRASYKNFDPMTYYIIDDYYEFESFDPLIVNLKEYDTQINTKDIFTMVDDKTFRFEGRKDLLRINGKEISKKYNDIKFIKSKRCDLIYDTLYNEIYLAIWSENLSSEFTLKYINNELEKISGGDHKISKVKKLYKQNFYSGVKLDQELIRTYFREKVEEYAKV